VRTSRVRHSQCHLCPPIQSLAKSVSALNTFDIYGKPHCQDACARTRVFLASWSCASSAASARACHLQQRRANVRIASIHNLNVSGIKSCNRRSVGATIESPRFRLSSSAFVCIGYFSTLPSSASEPPGQYRNYSVTKTR
jgi:hypothetical protein